LTSSYYRGAHAVIIGFDLSNKASFNNLNKWFEETKKYCDNKKKLVYKLGFKSDLKNNINEEIMNILKNN